MAFTPYWEPTDANIYTPEMGTNTTIDQDFRGGWADASRDQARLAREGLEQAQGGNSASQAQLRLGMGQAQRAGYQQALGRGANPLAQRSAMYNAGNVQTQTNMQSALLRAQETSAARQAYMDTMGQQAQGSMNYEQMMTQRSLAQGQLYRDWSQQKLDEEERERRFGMELGGMFMSMAGGAAAASDERNKVMLTGEGSDFLGGFRKGVGDTEEFKAGFAKGVNPPSDGYTLTGHGSYATPDGVVLNEPGRGANVMAGGVEAQPMGNAATAKAAMGGRPMAPVETKPVAIGPASPQLHAPAVTPAGGMVDGGVQAPQSSSLAAQQQQTSDELGAQLAQQAEHTAQDEHSDAELGVPVKESASKIASLGMSGKVGGGMSGGGGAAGGMALSDAGAKVIVDAESGRPLQVASKKPLQVHYQTPEGKTYSEDEWKGVQASRARQAAIRERNRVAAAKRAPNLGEMRRVSQRFEQPYFGGTPYAIGHGPMEIGAGPAEVGSSARGATPSAGEMSAARMVEDRGLALSDENGKVIGGGRVDSAAAATMRATPGEVWAYKPEAQKALGVTNRVQVGPTAQELERTPMGASVVYDTPQGKMVDTKGAVLQHYAMLGSLQRQNDQLRAEVQAIKGGGASTTPVVIIGGRARG